MTRSKNYNTRQREELLDYIISLGGEHVTAAQIVRHFSGGERPIGRTTVYRQLDRLVESGVVRRYTIDAASGACYEYTGRPAGCGEHFHLKCEDCGKLFHLQCEMMDKVRQHVAGTHAFKINSMKTVFYGKCEECNE